MTNQRRRKTQSLWLEALRLSTSSKISRRSARKTRENNTSDTCSNTQNNAKTQNADDTSPHPHPDDGNANEDMASVVRNSQGQAEASNSPDLEDTTELQDMEKQPSLGTHPNSQDDESESEPEPQFQPFHQDEGDGGTARLDCIPTNASPMNNVNDSLTDPIFTNTPAYIPTDVGVVGHHEPSNRAHHHISDSHAVSESHDVQTLENGLHHILQIWKCKLNLTAMVAVVGSVRYTVQQYDYARDMLHDAGAEPTWPPYAKTQRYFQKIIDTCMPNSKLVKLPRSTPVSRPSIRDEDAGSESDENSPELESTGRTARAPPVSLGTETVRIFLPSSWAKLDVATSVVFNEMFPSYNNNGEDYPSALERSAIIQDRASFASSCDHIFVNLGRCQVRCGHGSDIDVSVQSDAPSFETPFPISDGDDGYMFRTSVVTTWCVGSQRRSNSSAKRALGILSLSFQQRGIISALSSGSAPHTHTDADVKGPLPGDLCTLLSSEHRR